MMTEIPDSSEAPLAARKNNVYDENESGSSSSSSIDGIDDFEFRIVSTMALKWDKFQNTGISGQEGNDEGNEDDIMIFRTKPARPIRYNIEDNHNPIFFFRLLRPVIVPSVFATFALWYIHLKSRRKHTPTRNMMGEEHPRVSTTKTTQVHVSKTTKTTTAITEDDDQAQQTTPTAFQADSGFACIDDVSGTPGVHSIVSLANKHNPELSFMSMSRDETQGLIQAQNTHFRPPTTTTSSDHKLDRIRQLAQDIQLVQKVLKDQSLDPTLAPQLAMSMQSSHHLVESQREIHYQQAMLSHHHRQLDRQFSLQQHRESLLATQYDPDWQDKLQQQCEVCWNFWNGGVRLWCEVWCLQQIIILVILPVWKVTHQEITNGTSDEKRDAYQALFYDIGWSVLSKVCDCATASDLQDRTALASWTSPSMLAASIFITSKHSGITLSSVLALLNNVLPTWIDLDHFSCYGYCLASAALLGTVLATMHYLFRLLSMPPMVHHLVNLIGFVTFFGPSRITSSVLNAIAGLFAIPTVVQERDAQTLIEFTLMLSILVLLPLYGCLKTQSLYRDVRKRVLEVNPTKFQHTLQLGQQQLQQWKWEQKMFRYGLLTSYGAFLLGKGIRQIDLTYLENSV